MSIAKKLVSIGIVCVTLLLSACGQMATVPAAVIPTRTFTPTPPPFATPFPSVTPTPSPLQLAHITEKCLDVMPSKPQTVDSGGIVVLLGSGDFNIYEASLLNLENSQWQVLALSGKEFYSYRSMAVSPDRKTLAYGIGIPETKSVKLVLSNSNGERLKPVFWWSAYPFNVMIKWLNNQHLFVYGAVESQVFDPYTGKKQVFNPKNFKGIAQDQYGLYPFVLDPTLTKVMYPYDPVYIALADLPAKDVLTTLTDFTAARPEVAWLPDGSRVAVAGTIFVDQAKELPADEIFLLDKDGKHTQQATHLSAYYPVSDVKGAQTYHLMNLAWSPEGRYIAFWDNSLRLYVLDTETKNVTSYCTWGKHPIDTPKPAMWWPNEQEPVWSPDGKQLLIGYRDANDTLYAVIIDIKNNVAFSIANDMIPVGWMVSP